MANQIRVRPEKESLDVVLQLTGWLLLGVLLITALYFYLSLPDVVATHFNLKGEADAHGSKISLLLLPVFPILATIGMNWLIRYPYLFNYPVKITEENALRQYTLAIRLIRWLIVVINLLFFLILLSINQAAKTSANKYGAGIIVAATVLPFVPLAIYLIKSAGGK